MSAINSVQPSQASSPTNVTITQDLTKQFDVLCTAAAGDRVAEKQLIGAAVVVGNAIQAQVEFGMTLPRLYRKSMRAVYCDKEYRGTEPYLRACCSICEDEVRSPPFEEDDYCECVKFGDGGHVNTPATTRDTALRFARDVRGGLLGEIAAFLASRTAESETATLTLLASQVAAAKVT